MWHRAKAREDSDAEKDLQEEGYEPFAVSKEKEKDYDQDSMRFTLQEVIYIHYKKGS